MNRQKITRLTLNELTNIVEDTAKKVMEESIKDKEIQLAYKDIQQMGKHLPSLGLRLDRTPYYPLFQRMKEDMIKLNDAIIAQLKGGEK